jgi:hypothetical protein
VNLRRLSLVAVLALAGALVATEAPAAGGSAAAAATDCVWTQHSKKVTVRKKVGKKGHRHVRRIKRIKRWWTCDFPPVAPNRLRVRAREWSLLLSRGSVDAGDLTVELANEGEDPHNLHLELPGGASYSFEDLDPGQLAGETFPLTAGAWTLYCSLPGHEEAGMKASLMVN